METTLRRRVWKELDIRESGPGGPSVTNTVTGVVIALAVITVIVETEPTVYEPNKALFGLVNLGFAIFFTAEYLLRIWTMVERPQYSGPYGRLRYMVSFTALFDLVVVCSFWIAIGASDLFVLRLVRLSRILMLGRLGQLSLASLELAKAVGRRRYELLISVCFSLIVLVFAASLLFLAERDAQPEAFGSVPRALWWGVVTLTTVGYGDVAPVTTLGRVFASITALASIGVVALPTGILAAALSEAFQTRRARAEEIYRREHEHHPKERTGTTPGDD